MICAPAWLTVRMYCILNPSTSLYCYCHHSSPNHYHFLPGQLQVFHPTSQFFLSPSHAPCMFRPLYDFPGVGIKSNLLAKCKALPYLRLANSNFISSHASPNLAKPTLVQVQVLPVCPALLTSRLCICHSLCLYYFPLYTPSHTQFNVIS